jgi:hypothetical protein
MAGLDELRQRVQVHRWLPEPRDDAEELLGSAGPWAVRPVETSFDVTTGIRRGESIVPLRAGCATPDVMGFADAPVWDITRVAATEFALASESASGFRRCSRQDHPCMRLSRHAKNEMRLYGIGPEDVEATIADPVARDVDDRGNSRLAGETEDHRPILVVVAGDDPDFVITVFLRT